MKAYFIDPKAQTVEAIEYDGSYEATRQLVTGGEGYVDVSNVGGGNSIIVHDEGLIRLAESDLSGLDTMPLGWLLMQDEQPVSLLVGPALWVGYDADGMECDPSVPLELVRQHVRFLCRDVHEVGATIHAARRILSSCGVVENMDHLERIASGNQHTLTNLLFADALASEFPLQGRTAARAAMERRT